MKKLPNYWRWSRLGAEVSIRDDKIDPGKFPEEEFCFIGLEHIESNSGEIVPNLTKTVGKEIKSLKNVFKKGDVLYGRLRPALNKVILAENDGVCSTDIWILQSSGNVDPEFLAYYLRMKAVCELLTQSAVGGQLPRVSREAFSRVPLPLPPLPEQKRIVEILKQADALRRQRREILDQAKQLPTALFLEMFGNPKNYKSKWGIKPFGDFVTYSKYGPRFPDREYSGSGAHILRTTDMHGDGTLRWWESPILPVTDEELEQHALNSGTLLVSRSGTIGPIALFQGADETCIAGAYLIEFGLSDEINHQFLLNYFLTDYGQALLTGGSQSMALANLNAPTIKALQIPVPPIELQNKYAEQCEQIRRNLATQETANNEAEQIISVISGSAFSGHLTQSWREAHREELETWLSEHGEHFAKRPAKVKIETIAPPVHKQPTRPARRWLMDQLSEVQGNVYDALKEWKGTLIPSADLDEFLGQSFVEHLEDAHDQLRRALEQLAGLGLVAKVSLPTESGDFVTGYRVLREEELSKPDDLEQLGASA